MNKNIFYIIGFVLLSSSILFAQASHPRLTITQDGLAEIRANLSSNKLFSQVVEEAKAAADKELAIGIQVPIPKDMAGGYTHERHKQNFYVLKQVGNLYQITQEEKYATYIKDMLMAYAKLYPTLDLHPTKKSYATGKIFWQCLNDANWLVYVSQAYDCIYDYLSEEERTHLEKDLFRPMADFLSLENPKFFNRIHNHSTWANAAVGMIAIVMDDKELLNRALYGIENDGIDPNEVDNDGGYIKVDGVRQAGFLAQLDHSFSPDGYFTEGPYYLRYAIFPFLEFGQALNNYDASLDIFNYRDKILQKAINGLLLQTDARGEFFPVNDSQKGMSILSRELITAVDILYYINNDRKDLLSVAKQQRKVLLNNAGFKVAKDLEAGEEVPFVKSSNVFVDGAEGDRGGIAVLHKDLVSLVFKYSAQGMGHGHFDKLSYSYYDSQGEVVQDYGAVRWVNIDQKGGGRYLPENKSFGKQSIAHNTIVQNEVSHYKGSVRKGEAHEPDLLFTDIEGTDHQVIIAADSFAYKNTILKRNLMMIADENFNEPLLIDVFKVQGKQATKYDLPLWYMGHLLSTSFDYEKSMTSLSTIGDANGYQHIWQEAVGKTDDSFFQLGWFGGNKFYTYTGSCSATDQFILGRPGANDPNFNLRQDPVFIQRKLDVASPSYVNILESHGTYSRVTEIPQQPYATIKSLEVKVDNEDYIAFQFTTEQGWKYTVAYSHKDHSSQKAHKLKIDNKSIKWQGPYYLNKIKKY